MDFDSMALESLAKFRACLAPHETPNELEVGAGILRAVGCAPFRCCDVGKLMKDGEFRPRPARKLDDAAAPDRTCMAPTAAVRYGDGGDIGTAVSPPGGA
jgi:hypothetical protein